MGVIIYETQCEPGFGKKTQDFCIELRQFKKWEIKSGPRENYFSKIRFTNEFESLLKLLSPLYGLS